MHKYDEFYRLLCDSQVVQARAVREAERLGLTTTLAELDNLRRGTVKIANNVMGKIEADHVASLLEQEQKAQPQERKQHRAVEQDAPRSGFDVTANFGLFALGAGIANMTNFTDDCSAPQADTPSCDQPPSGE